MKKLIIVRHSIAEPSAQRVDRNRVLTPRGIERAERLALELLERIDFIPEFWVTSHANRAMHTATLFAEAFGCIEKITLKKSMYTFSATDLLAAIKAFPEAYNTAIVFTHNNAAIETIEVLSNQALRNFKPCSIGVLSFHQNEWQTIRDGNLLKIEDKN